MKLGLAQHSPVLLLLLQDELASIPEGLPVQKALAFWMSQILEQGQPWCGWLRHSLEVAQWGRLVLAAPQLDPMK